MIIQKKITVTLGFGPDEEIDPDKIRADFVKGLSAFDTKIDMAYGPGIVESLRNQQIETYPEAERVTNYLLATLLPLDYQMLDRPYKNLNGLTFGDLERIGKPYPMGGGGSAVDYVIKLLETDAPTAIAALGALSLILRQLIQSTVDKLAARAITVKIGEFSFSSTGLTKEEAIKEFEIYYSKFLESVNQEIALNQDVDSLPTSVEKDEG